MQDFVAFILRALLVATLWLAIWQWVQPRNQSMRILRAGLIAVAMFAVCAIIRTP